MNSMVQIKEHNYRQLKAYADNIISNPELKKFLLSGLELAFDTGDKRQLTQAMGLRNYPIGVEEFLFSRSFLGRPKSELYPAVVDELININDKHGRVMNTLTEFVGTGGIGCAKTTTALYTNAFQLYVLSCFKNPHAVFQMDSTSEILFIFQSLKASVAKDVDYARFREICKQSHYFTSVFPFDKRLESTMKFPNRIEAKPIGSDGGSIGQNVIGGLIDEVNFMSVIKDSKKVHGGGEYDQAKVIYEGVSRRIKSRFINNGGMPGILCLVSSKNYKGEFTDTKLMEARTDESIYIYDKRVWEVKPAGTYGKDRFTIFTGDATRKPRILAEDEQLSKEDTAELVMQIPVEHKKAFESDILGSLRDIAGVGTLARHPYMMNTEAVAACFGKRESILSKTTHDFAENVKIQVLPKRFIKPSLPRWIHLDLALTGDAAGVSCGYVSGFSEENVNKDGSLERLPIIEMDFTLGVEPPKGGEIKFFKIRELIYTLRKAGLNVKWVSADSYQSADSLQILAQKGYTVGIVSMDTSTNPYDLTKAAMYDGRLILPEDKDCQLEFLRLEKNAKTGKIDHPADGSKDKSDSVAGVVAGLSSRREIWAHFGVPLSTTLLNEKAVKTAEERGKK